MKPENHVPQPDSHEVADDDVADDDDRRRDVSQPPVRPGAASVAEREDDGEPKAASAASTGSPGESRDEREPRDDSAEQTGPAVAITDVARKPSAGTGAAGDEQRARLIERVKGAEVEFHDVVRLTSWQSLDPDDPRHAAGIRYADEAREKFKAKHGGDETRLAVYPSGTGVYLTPDCVFRWLIARSGIVFDFSEAHRLIYEIDAVAEQAREWWGAEPSGTGSTEQADQGGERNDRRPKRRAGRLWRVSAGRSALRPHLDRAYMLTTGVLAAIQEENTRQLEAHRKQGDKRHETSDLFTNNLALLRAQFSRAQELLQLGGQRDAQVRYGLGMICGVAALALICVLLGGIMLWRGVPAHYAVAVPAGGIGAVVSVLQRMTSGRLKLDVHAGRGMLLAYGAVRPLIGAVFGMVAFVLVAGDLLPSISVSQDAPLAFYAGLGFLAGFNERFAQDMLAGASMQSSPGGATPR